MEGGVPVDVGGSALSYESRRRAFILRQLMTIFHFASITLCNIVFIFMLGTRLTDDSDKQYGPWTVSTLIPLYVGSGFGFIRLILQLLLIPLRATFIALSPFGRILHIQSYIFCWADQLAFKILGGVYLDGYLAHDQLPILLVPLVLELMWAMCGYGTLRSDHMSLVALFTLVIAKLEGVIGWSWSVVLIFQWFGAIMMLIVGGLGFIMGIGIILRYRPPFPRAVIFLLLMGITTTVFCMPLLVVIEAVKLLNNEPDASYTRLFTFVNTFLYFLFPLIFLVFPLNSIHQAVVLYRFLKNPNWQQELDDRLAMNQSASSTGEQTASIEVEDTPGTLALIRKSSTLFQRVTQSNQSMTDLLRGSPDERRGEEEDVDVEAGEGGVSDSEDTTCVLCCDKSRSHIMMPCGHAACCEDCTVKVFASSKPLCPLCRQRIEQAMEIPERSGQVVHPHKVLVRKNN